MPLAALRHATKLRQAILALMLVLQCLLATAETLSETLSSDSHHQNASAQELLSQNTTGSGHSDASEACDHCCHCNGHSAHLALPLSQHFLPGERLRTTGLPQCDLAPRNNPGVIYRPPIA